MPRQRSAGRAPARPTVPARAPPAPTSQQQTRPATTHAAPPPAAAAPPAAASSGGSGLFGQMASTAAGVAVGHTVANGIMGMFGGSSSEAAPAEAASNSPQANQQTSWQQEDPNCAKATKMFTNCMDEQQGNMSICGWYMEQLKACQAAAPKY